MRLARHGFWMAAVPLCASCQLSSPPAENPPNAAPSAQLGPPPMRAPTASTAAAPPPVASAPSPTMLQFDEDVAFLNQHGAGVKVLSSPSGGRIAVAGKYQARVMTSAVEAAGASLGFVNRSFILAGKTGTAFDNYGGEDRFWLGPEGGQFALYFAPGKPFTFDNWQTPPAFQEGTWNAKAETGASITFARSMTLTNYAGTQLALDVERKLSILNDEQAEQNLGIELAQDVKWVGFESHNTITNRGKTAWSEDKGLPSIWILGMFAPAPGTTIVAPFEKQGNGAIVNDSYFGKVPADRLQVNEAKGFVLFKADGQARGKIGLSSTRAKAVLGSYSAQSRMLTVVRFTKPASAKRYVNNLWEISKEPYGGDVSNAYNDGPVEPGKPSLGGFYELESSSPAAALAPGATLEHTHETYHFSGPREALDSIAVRVLGVSLGDVESAKL
jgi:hypothetical protein